MHISSVAHFGLAIDRILFAHVDSQSAGQVAFVAHDKPYRVFVHGGLASELLGWSLASVSYSMLRLEHSILSACPPTIRT